LRRGAAFLAACCDFLLETSNNAQGVKREKSARHFFSTFLVVISMAHARATGKEMFRRLAFSVAIAVRRNTREAATAFRAKSTTRKVFNVAPFLAAATVAGSGDKRYEPTTATIARVMLPGAPARVIGGGGGGGGWGGFAARRGRWWTREHGKHTTHANALKQSLFHAHHTLPPDDANPGGNVHGGTILKMIDQAGYIAATQYCNQGRPEPALQAGLARLEKCEFLAPMHIGEVAQVRRDTWQLRCIAERATITTSLTRHAGGGHGHVRGPA
jgi:hypothetical protein